MFESIAHWLDLIKCHGNVANKVLYLKAKVSYVSMLFKIHQLIRIFISFGIIEGSKGSSRCSCNKGN